MWIVLCLELAACLPAQCDTISGHIEIESDSADPQIRGASEHLLRELNRDLAPDSWGQQD
jgi:hypothetical protein